MPTYVRRVARPEGASLIRAVIVAAILLCLAVPAPRAASAQRGAARSFVDAGTMTLVTDATAVDIDPASDEFAGSDMIARNIDDELVGLDGPHIDRYVPKLATSWSSNKDKSVWTFHLRHGVRFHTGRCCLTADDVKYSIGRTVAANLAGSYLFARFLDTKDPFKQIKVLDPYTVQFNLGRSQPVFLAACAVEYTALILDSRALKAHATKGDRWAHLWATDHDAGTGPYTIQSWQHGQQVVLTRFPGYWGGWAGPHFGTVVVRTVPETATRRELLERGQADLTYDLTPQDYQALSGNPKVSVESHHGTEIAYLYMTEWGPLASPYARQALSYAFNYDALIHGFYRGYAQRAYGPVPSALLGFDPHMFHYQTDLSKAKALLQKAGVKPGTTLTMAYTDPFGPAGEILLAQLAQIGITLKLQHLDTAAMNNILFGSEPPSQRPNVMAYNWWPDYNDPYDASVPLVASYSAGAAGANPGYYHDKQVDALLARMQYADREVLVEDAHKLQDITSRVDPPAIWTVEPAQVTILARSMKGFVFNPLEIRTYDFYRLHR